MGLPLFCFSMVSLWAIKVEPPGIETLGEIPYINDRDARREIKIKPPRGWLKLQLTRQEYHTETGI